MDDVFITSSSRSLKQLLSIHCNWNSIVLKIDDRFFLQVLMKCSFSDVLVIDLKIHGFDMREITVSYYSSRRPRNI
jgi:hypothetical protein